MQFFTKLNHVLAVMSEAADGPMGSSTVAGPDGEFAGNRARFLKDQGIRPDEVVMAGLVHGTAIHTVLTRPPEGRVRNTDGLITTGQIALAITTSDCFPVFFATLDAENGGEIAGIAHAGWRGVLNGIVIAMVGALESRGVNPRARLAAAIGPGIRECCFKIRDDVASKIHDAGYGAFLREINLDGGESLFTADLPGMLHRQLTALSIPEERIELAGECTCCSLTGQGDRQFFSRRRDHQKAQNMLSVIQLRLGRGTEAHTI